MREIRRPVQRIHIPPKLRIQPLARPLFPIDPVTGKLRPDPRHNQRLARAIRLRHNIHIALVLRRHTLFVVALQ